MRRLRALVALLAWFLWGVGTSGIHTAWVILSGPRRPAPALARLRFAPLSEAGVVVFASLITLTPGSTVVEVDREAREFLIHLLDGRDADRQATAIGARYEAHLRAWFGRRGA